MLLCGNQKSGNYFYLISVYTGLRPGSGTKSNVSFILGGEDHDSGIRLLSDGVSEVTLIYAISCKVKLLYMFRVVELCLKG
jgi:hypothetical protein